MTTTATPAPAQRCTTCDATGRVLACGCRSYDCDQCERGDLDICPDCIDGWRYAPMANYGA